jgi:DNA-binding XRE family transcriptional regulator
VNSLRAKIKEQGRTQRWISQKVGITETTLSRYISNKQNPSYKTAQKLALVLNCRPDDIFFNENTTITIK